MKSQPENDMLAILKGVIIAILLTLYFHYFVRDVLEKYKQKLTNIATMQSPINKCESIQMPTITLCMDPKMKNEVVLNYSIAEEYFNVPSKMNHLEKDFSMAELINKVSYTLGVDFKLVLSHRFDLLKFNLTAGENVLQIEDSEFNVNVTEIYSMVYGRCYNIFSDLNFSEGFFHFSVTKLDDSEGLNSIKVIIIQDVIENISFIISKRN